MALVVVVVVVEVEQTSCPQAVLHPFSICASMYSQPGLGSGQMTDTQRVVVTGGPRVVGMLIHVPVKAVVTSWKHRPFTSL